MCFGRLLNLNEACGDFPSIYGIEICHVESICIHSNIQVFFMHVLQVVILVSKAIVDLLVK